MFPCCPLPGGPCVWQVGRLMATLQDLGLDNNTAVFFASDNGAHLEGGHNYTFFNSTGGLLGHKR